MPAASVQSPPSLPGVERMESQRLLTADELATRWQVPKAHVYRLARDGRLPAVDLGRYRRFRLEAITEFEANGGTAHV